MHQVLLCISPVARPSKKNWNSLPAISLRQPGYPSLGKGPWALRPYLAAGSPLSRTHEVYMSHAPCSNQPDSRQHELEGFKGPQRWLLYAHLPLPSIWTWTNGISATTSVPSPGLLWTS